MKRAGPCTAFLFAALAASLPACAARTDVSPLLRTHAGRFTGWVSTDLDGDRRPDLASAAASRRDGHSYLQDITLRLSGFEDSIITVRTSRAAVRLTVRDLDGDANRDLILETFNREPVAVLLNDGEGRFHQGNLEDFRFQLSHRSSRWFESVNPEPLQIDPSECPNDDSVTAPFFVFWPDLAGASLIAAGETNLPVSRRLGASTRGPPGTL
jgi:hypothetical protein